MKSKHNNIDIEIGNSNNAVKYDKSILDNGVTIISEEIPSVESFSLGIGVGVGSRDDDFNMPGIAHFLEHSVYRRTKNRTSKQIANQFDAVGAYSNAYTTKELTLFYVRATKKHFATTFDLLSDIVLNPVFKTDEISKERQIIIEEIKSYDDDPEEFIFDLADSVVFSQSTMGNSIDGTIESLKRIKTDTLDKFHKEHYTPENLVVAIAGNIKHSDAVSLAHKYFDEQKSSTRIIERTLPSTIVSNNTSYKPIQQAHLILGKQTIGNNHPDKYAFSLLNIIFGDGLSSRIYQTLREKEGLAYTVFSNLNLYSDCGSLYMYIATDKNNVNKSEDLLLLELEKLTKNKVTKTELSRAKEQLKTVKILEFESMSARMQSLAKNELLARQYETLAEMINSIDQVKIDDLVRLAAEHYNTQNLCRIALLPE